MLDYAFLEIMETLTRKELKSFRRFVLSPYFNRSRKVIKLFDLIVKYHPNYDNPSMTKEKLHQGISPDLPYNDSTMRRLFFDLQNLTDKFMQQLHLEKKKAEAGIFLIEELVGRGSSKTYYRNSKDVKKVLDSAESLDSEVCLNRFRLDTDDFYFGMIHNKINKKSFVDSESGRLISGITYLISFFMLEAIKHNDTLLEYSRSYNVKYNEKFINQFINLFDFERLEIFMKSNKMAGSHLIEVYLNTLKAFLYFDNEQYYHDFKKSLYSYQNELSLTDNHFLFIRLAGYCAMKILADKNTNSHFDRELFSIYKIILQKKYYESDGNNYLPVDLFRNILVLSCKLKEIKWLEDFIQGYGRLLHPERRKVIIIYANALLYFERSAYDESLEYLSMIQMEEFTYHLDIRNLYIRIYYEQEDYESAFAYAETFKKYLDRNKLVSDEKKLVHQNFIGFVYKLININNANHKTNLTSLRLRISKCKKLEHKDWLLAKAQSLDKSIRRAI